jgi:hypothetical protein
MNIAIYVKHNIDDLSLLEKIKDFYTKESLENNVFIANANIMDNALLQNFACINSTALSFMKGKVVFTRILDFVAEKDNVFGDIVLVIKKNQIVDLTPKIIEESQILISDTTKIRKIKNAELQHLK